VQVTISVDAAVISLKATAQDATEEGNPLGVITESKPLVHFPIFLRYYIMKKKFIDF
jgi:hypothetical protein